MPLATPAATLLQIATNDIPTLSVATMGRRQVVSQTVQTSSGAVRLTYFTADKTLTVGNFRSVSGGVAAGATPTLCKMGCYSVASDGGLTLIGSTASDTALWAATATAYTKAAQSSFQVVRGSRYAFALIVVTGATIPTFAGVAPGIPSTLARVAPVGADVLTGQTDLPSTIADSALAHSTAQMFYGELTT